MKPHFHPGDQVITKWGQTGTIDHGERSATTGRWYYWVILDGGKRDHDPYWESHLWHLDSAVARKRAYARKGKLPPERESTLRGSTDTDDAGGMGQDRVGAQSTLDECVELPGLAEIRRTLDQNSPSPHALHFTDEVRAPSGPLPVIPSPHGDAEDHPDPHQERRL